MAWPDTRDSQRLTGYCLSQSMGRRRAAQSDSCRHCPGRIHPRMAVRPRGTARRAVSSPETFHMDRCDVVSDWCDDQNLC